MSKNKKQKSLQVETNVKFYEEKEYQTIPGFENGKASEEVAKSFRAIGFKFAEGKKPTKKAWAELPVNLQNYYKRQYPKLTESLA